MRGFKVTCVNPCQCAHTWYVRGGACESSWDTVLCKSRVVVQTERQGDASSKLRKRPMLSPRHASCEGNASAKWAAKRLRPAMSNEKADHKSSTSEMASTS
eukprot:6172388-Pleurochrysis_carterae.AAC.5